MSIVSVEQMRQVQWHLNFRWAVRFPSAPIPFNTWFPAVSLDEGLATIEKMDFAGGTTSFAIAKNTSLKTVDMSIVDGGIAGGNLLPLHDWIVDWIRYIIPDGGFVRTITEISRQLEVIKYDGKGNTFKSTNYMVFPDGSYKYQGSSSNDTANLDLSFVISAKL